MSDYWFHKCNLTFQRNVAEPEKYKFIESLEDFAEENEPYIQFECDTKGAVALISACLPDKELEKELLPFIEMGMFKDTYWLTTPEDGGPIAKFLSISGRTLREHDILPILGRETGMWRYINDGYEYQANAPQKNTTVEMEPRVKAVSLITEEQVEILEENGLGMYWLDPAFFTGLRSCTTQDKN